MPDPQVLSKWNASDEYFRLGSRIRALDMNNVNKPVLCAPTVGNYGLQFIYVLSVPVGIRCESRIKRARNTKFMKIPFCATFRLKL